ncbi:carbohydrate ABC transporter permease [Marinovum sp. 2_MG-2023]|uniref:carbohydrate ABC transporter permease n=1 Tax=Roseobacteraceae TaxID=2854170 RepID=UPI001FD1F710|nr:MULTISPECIES: carbohydrate ABC transporter permease [Roseobacteraceae]MCJ7874062.1 carbohydrate ABC transporter permease [Phaeobacter sp. J2-8]MDO6732041.1 carbohydrate ABC transporter permease [Marinovum sp. 2_MG-2023]MDO6781293.1 carbohydrate ABC transporter permease [Marinovum sp. 1_MG-2023]
MEKRSPLATFGLYAAAISACAILLFPIYWMIVTALQPATNLRSYPPQFWPAAPQWNVFGDILAKHPYAMWFMNSILIALATMIMSLAVSILAAYALSRFRLKGGTGLGLFILTSKMLPATLMIIPLFAIFKSVGLVGSLWSVVIAQATLIVPFCTWMLKGYFDTIPPELEQAALVDGCSPLGTIFRIVLPVAAPGLAATALYAFVVSWSDFLFGRTFLTTNDENWTLQMGIASLKGEFVTEWNVIMAGSLMASVPIIIVYLFLERFLVGGLAAGSEK